MLAMRLRILNLKNNPVWHRTGRFFKRYGVFFFVVVAGFLLLPRLNPAEAISTSSGDGVMFYGQSGNTTPQWRTYQTANNFGAASNTVTGAVPLYSKVRTSPTAQEAVAGYINSSGTLQIACFNGISWTNEWSISVGGTGTTGRFDIAYETTTGDVMVVYSTNASGSNEMAYRTKPGASACGSANWSGATNIDAQRTGGTVLWIRMEGSVANGSNTIGLAWSDNANDLSAMEWTGSSWAVAEPAAALETELERVSAAGDSLAFDIAMESTSGDLMVAWGVNTTTLACTVGSTCMRSAQYVASWSAVAAIPTVADGATNIDIASNPNNNEIVLGAIDHGSNTTNANDLSAAYWSGTAWTGKANQDADTAAPVAGTKLVAAGWLISGATTRSIITYNDAATTNIGYVVGSGTGTFTTQTDATPSPVFANPQKWYDIQTDPFQKDRLLFSLSDNNSDLFSKRLIMTATPAFTWTNADGSAALETTLGQATYSPFSFAYWRYIPPVPPGVGSGQVIYGEGTVATPRNREFTGSTNDWSAESSLPTNTSTTHSTIIKANPKRDEMIAGVINSSGVLNVYRWNGSSWSSEWTVTTGINRTPRVAIAFEAVSGDAVVAYSTNTGTTNEINYRVYNGTSWTSATNFDPQRTSGTVEYIVAETRPGTDEIAMVWGDTNRDLSAAYWNGSSWTSEPASLLENELGRATAGSNTVESPVLDLAFESTSGDLMVAWGRDATDNTRYVMRTAGTGGTWGSSVAAAFNAQGSTLVLESDPSSDQIAYINHANWSNSTNVTTQRAEAAVWSGSAWTVSSLYDTNALTDGELDVAAVWLESGGSTRAVFTFDRILAPVVDYFSYNPATGIFSALADSSATPTPVGTDDKVHRLVRNPSDGDEAMYLMTDANADLFARKVSFDGVNINWNSVDPSGAVMENSVSVPTNIQGWEAAYDFKRYTPPSGALTADIVDAGGSSVASPSLSMANTAVSADCQNTTGTFGTSAEKIRVNNTTATPGWSLSIAATGGVTSNWSSGLSTYDFNDPSGSPTGCGDGGDADSIAGRLSLNPSAGTITPQGGCSATGVSQGSSSSFNQGSADSLTLMSGSGSAQTNCYWDQTGVGVSQDIPPGQQAGSYTINMTITVVAN